NYNVAATTTFGTTNVFTDGAPNLDFQNSGNGCTGTISAGNVCAVNVTFAPLVPGPRSGAVQLFDNNNNLLATTFFHGTGNGSAAAFEPANTVAVGNGLYHPTGVAVDGAGDVFVGDSYNG